jgi:hypothetical protein
VAGLNEPPGNLITFLVPSPYAGKPGGTDNVIRLSLALNVEGSAVP